MADNSENRGLIETENNAERTRTIRWQDPLIGAQKSRTLSGLDYMRAIRRRG